MTITPIATHELAHREDFRRYVIEHAEPWHRTYLGRLYDLWEAWNHEYFDGRMVPPYILLSEPSNPRRLGDCALVSGFGGHAQIRIRPSLLAGTHPAIAAGDAFLEGRFLFVADVLLHEMIHQWQYEVSGQHESGYHGHGPAFRDMCNRIGAKLGLPPVRTSKARGKDKDLPSCSYWPHDVRPDHYYQALN